MSRIRPPAQQSVGQVAATSPAHTRTARATPLLALLLSAQLGAAPLPAVVDQVLQRHPDIRSSQALLEASQAQMRQVRSDFYPTLGLNYRQVDAQDSQTGVSVGRDTKRGNATLRWNLFNGRIDSNRLRSAGLNQEAAVADLDDAHERIALEVTERYAELVRLRQRLEVADTLIKEFEALRASVKNRVDAGRVSPADLDQIESDLIRIRVQRSQLRGQLGGGEYRFQQLTGQPPANLSAPWLEAPDNARGLEQLQALLENDNPQLRAGMKRVAARAAEVNAARGAYWPSLDLELNRRLYADISPAAVTDTQRSNQISLNLEIPLGGRTFARVDESVERHKAARAAADSLRINLSGDLGALHQELAEARVIQPELVERVETTSRVYHAYRLQFDAGKRSLLDVATAQNERFSAIGDVIDNRNLQLLDQARLLSMIGKLRQALANGYHDTPLTAPKHEQQAAAEPVIVTPETTVTKAAPLRTARVARKIRRK
ncbi:MAG: TolC family protein [Pseudomonadota bacterium]|nr:TolC family protein [Pseudomonadota bacterium]MDP1905181.1 TolC family protein [Pseudomonadota bacterium]MDP2353403.1 TolC family protein [Pseudomonadota bacterium]